MVDFHEMNEDDVSEWLTRHFNETIATKCAEQQIDGFALEVLATKGTPQQLENCGLVTVGAQLKLQRLVISQMNLNKETENPATIMIARKKPSKREIKECGEVNQRLYNAKKKAVRAAAIEKWPGNNIPIFRKNKEETAQLDYLVEELDHCLFQPVGFDKAAIRQHIIDVMNERRRSIRKGHDYTSIDKRTIKRIKREELSTDIRKSEATIRSSTEETDEHEDQSSSESSSQLPTLPSFTSGDQVNESHSDDNSCSAESECNKDQNKLSFESCKIIVIVAFGAIKYTDVPRTWVISLLKKYVGTRSVSSSISKDSAVVQLVPELLKNGIVELTCHKSKDMAKISRNMVKRLQKL